MNNRYILDLYEPSDHLPFGKKVAEVDITYKTYDEIQHLVEVEREYYGRNAKLRRALCVPTTQSEVEQTINQS